MGGAIISSLDLVAEDSTYMTWANNKLYILGNANSFSYLQFLFFFCFEIQAFTVTEFRILHVVGRYQWTAVASRPLFFLPVMSRIYISRAIILDPRLDPLPAPAPISFSK